MYYEEKFIDGKLMFRTIPEGDWHINNRAFAKVANKVLALTEDERVEVFSCFCNHCGSTDTQCQCWNDE